MSFITQALRRETTAHSIYVQLNIAVAGTAGKASALSGAMRSFAWTTVDAHVMGALEAVHCKIGNTIRQAGGHDGNYLGPELKQYALMEAIAKLLALPDQWRRGLSFGPKPPLASNSAPVRNGDIGPGALRLAGFQT